MPVTSDKGPAQLLHRRVVRRAHEYLLDAGDQRSAFFGRLLRLLPVRVVRESVPVLVAGLLARVADDEVELPLVLAGAGPVADVLDTVLLEQLQGVISEPLVQRVHLAGGRGVDPHLVVAALVTAHGAGG